MAKRLKVLMSAYACEPNKGSEPEVGWQWAMQMARFHDVTVLTRANNRAVIEKEIAALGDAVPVPQFIYHDEGPFLLWLKKRFGAVRSYYVLWQISAWHVIHRLHLKNSYDILHHVTFAGFRYRTAIWNHGSATIWGPVGGIESIPWRLLPWKHPASLFPEMIRNLNNIIQAAPFHVLPKRAQTTMVTLVSTREMERTFLQLGFRTTLMPTIGLLTSALSHRPREATKGPLRILFVGNIITLKGIDLAIEALHASGCDATFTMVGSGNYEPSAQKLVSRLGLEKRVVFRGRLPRQEVLGIYADFDVFLFPTLHDTGGYAVIEAMFNRLPVICLDCGGPRMAVREGAGVRVPLGRRRDIIARLADAIQTYDKNRDLLAEHGHASREIVLNDYDWDKKGIQLNAIYERAVAERQANSPATSTTRLRGGLRRIIPQTLSVRGVAISLIILAIIGLAGFLSVNHLKADAKLIVEDTLAGISEAGAANASMSESFNRVLLSLMAETPEERQRCRTEINDFSRRTSEALHAYQESIFSDADRFNYDRVLRMREAYQQVREQTLVLIDGHKQMEALGLYKNSLVPAYRRYKAAAEELLEYNTRQSKVRGEAILKICTGTQYAVAGIGILLFVVGFIVGLFK
jgi:glycosyltransferase involved in cell wall biosynthesis